MNTRKWILLGIVGLILIFFFVVRTILRPFLFAAIIAYVAYPFVNLFEKRQVPRSMAIILVYLIFGVIIGLVTSFLIPQLIHEVDELLKTLPQQTEMFADGLAFIRNVRQITMPEILKDGFDLIIGRVQFLIERMAQRLTELLVGLFSQVVSLAIAPFLAFYLLRDMEKIKRRTLMYIPRPYRLTVYKLTKEINEVINGFVRGQLLNAFLVGVLIAIGLAIVGIKYALFIGLLAGLFDIIPYFGPVIGSIPALVLALAKSPTAAIWVIVVFVAVNQIESNIISPRILGEKVGLHPLAVIFAVLAGGELMGIIGMLIAVPVAGIIRVLLNHLLIYFETH